MGYVDGGRRPSKRAVENLDGAVEDSRRLFGLGAVVRVRGGGFLLFYLVFLYVPSRWATHREGRIASFPFCIVPFRVKGGKGE